MLSQGKLLARARRAARRRAEEGGRGAAGSAPAGAAAGAAAAEAGGPALSGERIVRQTVQNDELRSAFASMSGKTAAEAQLRVIYPKFCEVRRHADRFVQLFKLLGRLQARPLHEVAARVADYVRGLGEAFDAAFQPAGLRPALARLEAAGREFDRRAAVLAAPGDYEVTGADRRDFFELHSAVGKSAIVNTVVTSCAALARYKGCLRAADALRDSFLRRPGSFEMAHGLAVDFRALYNDPRMGADDRSVLLMLIYKIYEVGQNIYKALTAPDFDIDLFVGVILDSMGELRRQLPDCKEAISELEKSVGLMKERFGVYNADYVTTGNMSLMMESFIRDVSQKHQAEAQKSGKRSGITRVAMQFQKIGKFFRRQSAGGAIPKMSSALDVLDQNFRDFSQLLGREGDDEDGAEDGAAPPPEAPRAEPPPIAALAPCWSPDGGAEGPAGSPEAESPEAEGPGAESGREADSDPEAEGPEGGAEGPDGGAEGPDGGAEDGKKQECD